MAYVMMAIPAELVPAVADLIERSDRGTLDLSPSTDDTEGFVHGWDERTVWRAYQESANKMRHLLDFLASNPDREVTSEEMAEAIDARFGWNTVAGMLGAFGRRCKGRYGRSKPMWTYRYDDDGRVLVTVPDRVAEALRAADGMKS